VKKAILLCAVVLLVACSKDIQNKEAVRQAVLDNLRARAQETGLNMDGMEVDVTAVSFAKDQARATVTFRVKGAAQQQPVRVEYLLDRQSNKWVVRSKGEAGGGSPHDGGGPPPAAPPGGALPPGHPPLGKQ